MDLWGSIPTICNAASTKYSLAYGMDRPLPPGRSSKWEELEDCPLRTTRERKRERVLRWHIILRGDIIIRPSVSPLDLGWSCQPPARQPPRIQQEWHALLQHEVIKHLGVESEPPPPLYTPQILPCTALYFSCRRRQNVVNFTKS